MSISTAINLHPLYKIDSKGKVRVWRISIAHTGVYPEYMIEHGVNKGKMVTTSTEIKGGKNIGRANETTPGEQAVLEAESLWNKQLSRKGYSQTVPTSKADQPFAPMLAKSYNKPGTDLTDLKDGKHIGFPCYYQPKLDGIRCTANLQIFSGGYTIYLRSRQYKIFESLPHICDEIRDMKFLHSASTDIYLDGELYVHGEEFQELTSAIKRDEPSENSAKVEYHIYDVFDRKNPDWSYNERMKWLEKNIVPNKIIKLVKAGVVNNASEVRTQLHANIKLGYEGIMLRNTDGVYKARGRSKDLQKVKLFIDEEFEIVDAKENKGKMQGQCTLICKTKEGHTFGVKPEGSDAVRRQYWVDFKAGKLTGEMLTVRFFAWTTSKKSVPRFPVGIAVRNYENP